MQTLKEARKYAYNLVADGKTQYHMLDEYEKSALAGHIMASADKMHIWEYITEADYKNELPNIVSDWLVHGCFALPSNLVETIRINAINYASKEAIRILEEQQQEWEFDKKFNHE